MAVNYVKKDEKPAPAKSAKPDRKDVGEVKAEIEGIEANPKSGERKLSITIRLDQGVVEFFKAGGTGWQTRINEVLKDHIVRKIEGGK